MYILKSKIFKLREDRLQSLLLWLMLLFAFGGTFGRFFLGLSLFDFLLMATFFNVILSRKLKLNRNLLLYFLLFLYGALIAFLNKYVFAVDKQFEFFITEGRFYLYIPILYLIILNTKSLYEITDYFYVHVFIFIVVYLLNFPGTIIYSFFNSDLIELGIEEFTENGRVRGLPIIPLTIMVLLYFKNKRPRPIIIFLYLTAILVFYTRTESRTNLIFSLLPFVYLILNTKVQTKILILILTTLFVFYAVPFLLDPESLQRFQNILNPLNDPAVNYRLLNYANMFTELADNILVLIFGWGIGANYTVNISIFLKSYFLDNTFLTMIYKVGVVGLIMFITILVKELKQFLLSTKLTFLLILLIPAISSYHVITQPAYLMAFFILSINEKRENQAFEDKKPIA
ncbi:hypothetical protein [Salinivirga cyanobacteriivorans]